MKADGPPSSVHRPRATKLHGGASGIAATPPSDGDAEREQAQTSARRGFAAPQHQEPEQQDERGDGQPRDATVGVGAHRVELEADLGVPSMHEEREREAAGHVRLDQRRSRRKGLLDDSQAIASAHWRHRRVGRDRRQRADPPIARSMERQSVARRELHHVRRDHDARDQQSRQPKPPRQLLRVVPAFAFAHASLPRDRRDSSGTRQPPLVRARCAPAPATPQPD
jgi:hypothetical protein